MDWKPLVVLFVGDEPSSKNVSKNLAFVGTKSYKRLLSWIAHLDLPIENVIICNKDQYVNYKNMANVVFFLGQNAEKYCRPGYSIETASTGNGNVSFIRHKTLPHPSPRNRQFNDKKFEKVMLDNLKKWLYS